MNQLLRHRLPVLILLLTSSASLHADTSYLLMQGAFGSGGATATDEWAVTYTPGTTGAPVYGQDLLNAVFGTPIDTHSTYTDAFGTFELFKAGNNTQGASYIDYGGGYYFATSFTFNGITVAQNTSTNPSWNYYVSGGPDSSPYNTYPNSNYPSSVWNYSDDGSTTRALVDGSFDGWVYGQEDPNPPYTAATIFGYNPTLSGFSGTQTLVSSVNGVNVYSIQTAPEPGRAALLVIGSSLILMHRRRQRPSKMHD